MGLDWMQAGLPQKLKPGQLLRRPDRRKPRTKSPKSGEINLAHSIICQFDPN
ncbi:hypothetical protein Maes01_02193 [Microbulbifer aestuariivivens]|uniref:Transposase n=1 Tax=Microbulbifer aestuariivivens TaxID=1908308 RepID=A0ABP9WT34_9GAMM